ncbi:hypothetical protein [Natronoglycomyces albus]|uniref:Uncharacterized protein n=1 Tax=Natronoglycomyces albus TaxID=2811108 RepID=A0A895XPB3_9ACTN|nr:hypothetical protein [Natronoglycomyces albus]QSB04130.1 hypothetical protein JQS30_09920 [Natronoglycomyces albus]
MNSEHAEVALPREQVDQIRRLVAAGRADSVAAYVEHAVQARLDRDRSLEELKDLFDRKGHSPSMEHLAWAREVLGVDANGEGEAKL